MTKYYILLTALLVSIANIGCVKNSENFIEYHSIDNYFLDVMNSSDVHTVTFSNDDDYTIHIDSGSKIEISESAFVDVEGNEVEGQVTVKYVLLDKIGQYINYNIPTNGLNSLLDARNMIYIRFEQDGSPLRKNKLSSGFVQVYYPAETIHDDASQYTLSDGGWVESQDIQSSTNISPTTYTTIIDGVEKEVTGYKMEPISFHWLCIATPLGSSDGKYTICADLPENYNNVNSNVYCTLERHMTLIPMDYSSEKFLFCGEIVGAASDQKIEIVVISDQGIEDKYNFGTKSAILNNSNIENITPTLKSRAEIEAELDKL